MYRIGLMLPQIIPANVPEMHYYATDEVYYAPILRAIKDTFADQSVQLEVLHAEPNEYLDSFRKERLDGMVVMMLPLDHLPILRQLFNAGVCYVALGISGSLPRDADLPCVDCANRDSGRSAAEHLLARGHKRFGCVNLATYYMNHSDRMQGFIETVSAAGFPVEEDCMLLKTGYKFTWFGRYASEWIQGLHQAGNLPTAIFTCDFNMAASAINALRHSGLTIPGDVSLVGFDDPPAAETLSPPLTTIRQPVREMGLLAARRLLAALQHPDGPKSLCGTDILSTELVVRGTTGDPRQD
jgi:LacI family transcriptional regulator